MEALQEYLSQIRVPTANEPIYKDECVYSYDNPETSTGLYVSLNSFLSFGDAYVSRYAEKTGNAVFLHIRREKFLKEGAAENDNEEAGPDRKISRLAIGIEGGYNDAQTKKYEYKNTYSIFVMGNLQIKIPYPDQNLPMLVTQSVEAVLAQDSAIMQLEKQTLTGTWDGELRQVSIYSGNLKQLDNGKKIPPSGWKCEKCELTNNLWLNLSDGSILCGRKFFDGTGGNDHAVEHFNEVGYPLAVKLGTITADGKSDVFSYPEDDMVIDTQLEKHLAHFGINMAAMKKSEKSMVELELEINQRIGEWSLLTESDSELQPLAGPGYTGMQNLGNSCYINSVMQVIYIIPDFIKRFTGDGAEKYFKEFPADPANNFDIQMSKLGNGLWSGKYSSIAENSLDSESTGISPTMFKNVISKNHAEFSSKQQQDVHEFYLHFLNVLERNSRHQENPADALAFHLEERLECAASKRVRYTKRDEYYISLPIPLEKATNLDEVKAYLAQKAATGTKTDKDVVRHKVPFAACLEAFFAEELVEQFYSSAINGITNAKKSTRLASMPDFLLLHLRKFALGEDWVPKKLDVSVKMPDHLDLSKWRSKGMQQGEQELPASEAEAAPKFNFDETILSGLMEMGYPMESCKRAIYHTKNIGLVQACDWLMSHLDDADIAEPFVVPATCAKNAAAAAFIANPDSLAMLMGMGFNECQALKALKATENNIERATDWIFNHSEEMDVDDFATGGNQASGVAAVKSFRDGAGKYKLVAFISHMGTSAQAGHYVCHILKEGRWVIYNDSKVALSKNPPQDLGYLYLYKREE